jgi:hypothetical protein
MTVVAIHQPNYLPWLGYFAKMAASDVFVLLDDVQFSKGSYTNRVQIDRAGTPAWLTLPIRHSFGATIGQTTLAREDWARSHLDTLKQSYRRAACFDATWREFEATLRAAKGSLAEVNAHLVRWLAAQLGLATRIEMSSNLALAGDLESDARLAEIVAHMAPGGTYLSGAGGAKYQTEATFAARGVSLAYSSFNLVPYGRGSSPFLPGLSIVDALFHLGPDKTATLIKGYEA